MSKWSAWPADEIKDLSEIRQRHARDESRSSLRANTPYVMHRDREWLLAEVERLRADLAVQQGCCDGAAAQDAHIRQEREEHRAEIERLRAEVERGHRAHKIACEGGDLLRDEIKSLLAEVERLRAALVLGSEVLASHQGSPQREWHSAGAWLYPGDSINVVRAPLPEIRVEP